MKFNDLPARYLTNINSEPPFGGKPGGSSPRRRSNEFVAFLGTLNDAMRPESSGKNLPPKASAVKSLFYATADHAMALLFSRPACTTSPAPLI